MFDSKLLSIINDESEIESISLKNIDGVIFSTILSDIL